MNVRDDVLTIIERVREPDDMDNPPSDEQRFVEDLGMDSYKAVELVLALEKFFNIEISDDEVATTHTVGEAVALVSRKAAH